MPFGRKVTSTRVPGCQLLHRGDAYAPRTRVLSERHFLRHRFAWARKLCCQSLRDTPFGSTVGSTGWNGCGHEPWKPPGPAGCPERRLTLSMGFATPKINRVSAVKWTRWNTLVVRLEVLNAKGFASKF